MSSNDSPVSLLAKLCISLHGAFLLIFACRNASTAGVRQTCECSGHAASDLTDLTDRWANSLRSDVVLNLPLPRGTDPAIASSLKRGMEELLTVVLAMPQWEAGIFRRADELALAFTTFARCRPRSQARRVGDGGYMSVAFIHLPDIHFGQEKGGAVSVHDDVKVRRLSRSPCTRRRVSPAWSSGSEKLPRAFSYRSCGPLRALHNSGEPGFGRVRLRALLRRSANNAADSRSKGHSAASRLTLAHVSSALWRG
jgi:hypothetical protein